LRRNVHFTGLQPYERSESGGAKYRYRQTDQAVTESYSSEKLNRRNSANRLLSSLAGLRHHYRVCRLDSGL